VKTNSKNVGPFPVEWLDEGDIFFFHSPTHPNIFSRRCDGNFNSLSHSSTHSIFSRDDATMRRKYQFFLPLIHTPNHPSIHPAEASALPPTLFLIVIHRILLRFFSHKISARVKNIIFTTGFRFVGDYAFRIGHFCSFFGGKTHFQKICVRSLG
jgi:hypothetical protein